MTWPFDKQPLSVNEARREVANPKPWKRHICRFIGHDKVRYHDRVNNIHRTMCARCGLGGYRVPSLATQARILENDELRK